MKKSNKQAEKSGNAVNISDALAQLRAITLWFSDQEEIDLEAGLLKIKEGATLIKASKKRLQEIENEFEEIRATLDSKENEGERGDIIAK